MTLRVLVQQHYCRKSPDRGLDREKLLELLARLVEQRLCTRQLDGDRDAVGAHELDVLAHIGIRDDQRILDHRLSLLREQTIEAAVERHACDDRHQHRRNCRNDGEQCHDTHMQARRRAAAAPRLHYPPHLSRDHQNEKEHSDRVGEKQRNHDLMRRRDRSEAGEHDKGYKRGQQRERHGRETERPGKPSRCWCCRSVNQFRGRGLADSAHQLVSPNGNSHGNAMWAPPRLMLLYNNVAGLRQFRGAADPLWPISIMSAS